jgi:hypothetical protein
MRFQRLLGCLSSSEIIKGLNVQELKDYMYSNHTSLPPRFIPFNRFHIAPLGDVTPAAIEAAAKLACTLHRDRDPLELNTALNFIAKKLGFRGGFGGFRQEYDAKLLPFMKENGLVQRTDLINKGEPAFDLVSLKPRQVSDRLFRADQPFPCRLFTGYDIDWYELNNLYFRSNPWTTHPEYKLFCLPYDLVMMEFAEAKAASSDRGRQVLEAAVAACAYIIQAGADNLLGDQLLCFGDGGRAEIKFVPRIYRPRNCSPQCFAQNEKDIREVAKFFRFWIDQQDKGWVNVVRYNESLVFLKGRDGAYDFLFPGFRDELFNHNPFEPHLCNDDVPKSNDAYHFKRWLYFHYAGWLELEEHCSEITFHSFQHTMVEYPGAEQILKQHLILKREYRPPKKTAQGEEGFFPTCIDGVLLYVSNLVPIRQFREFMTRNPQYADYSRRPVRIDRWETVNCDEDESLPAAVTWFDANAYATWISKTKGLPVRLLTDGEYQKIARPIVQPAHDAANAVFLDQERERLCRFYLPDGTPLAGHPPYMPEEDFQSLHFRFIHEAISWKRAACGLVFLVSYHFGEWLNEQAEAVNSRSLSSLCYLGFPPARGQFAATSTGKYKSKKIGFRLCYMGTTAEMGETGQSDKRVS